MTGFASPLAVSSEAFFRLIEANKTLSYILLYIYILYTKIQKLYQKDFVKKIECNLISL